MQKYTVIVKRKSGQTGTYSFMLRTAGQFAKTIDTKLGEMKMSAFLSNDPIEFIEAYTA